VPLIEIDGQSPSAEQLAAAALDNYGHFTAMQVRGHRVRGADLHLARLGAAQLELFGTSLDTDLVRSHVRHALAAGNGDASVRVHVRQPDDRPVVMVTVREPAALPGDGRPWRLQSVPYRRAVAHIKRVSDFGQAYYQRLVNRNGFDEALLTGPDGVISEGSITNVGFVLGGHFTWPNAPMLAGVTMQLLDRKAESYGIGTARREIRLADLHDYQGAFVTNSRGFAPVAQIDDVPMPEHQGSMKALAKLYDSIAWDEI
jgi:branched-subunit amino acid aminotransferase/4-amino-4-deoxychorismate lyase